MNNQENNLNKEFFIEPVTVKLSSSQKLILIRRAEGLGIGVSELIRTYVVANLEEDTSGNDTSVVPKSKYEELEKEHFFLLSRMVKFINKYNELIRRIKMFPNIILPHEFETIWRSWKPK